MPSAGQRVYGTDEAVAPARALRAGPLALLLQGARLRYIRCGDHEVWHALAFVLRDADWGTPEPVVDGVAIDERADAFEARIEGHFSLPEPLRFQLEVAGGADGSLRLNAQAVSATDLWVNRIGMCLLHPLQACGMRVEVTHVDGRTSTSTFPELIPPWPPFTLVRGLRHEWAPGCWAAATLDGDLFETEDQRNNADASFKTYSRSNMAPRPYRLSAGVAVRQSALLRLGALPRRPPSRPAAQRQHAAAPLRVAVGADAGFGPALGVEIHAADARAPGLLPVLAELAPCLLHLAWRPGLDVDWRGVAAMLRAAGARLRLDTLLPDDGDATAALQALKAGLDSAGIEVAAVAVYPSHNAPVEAARRVFAPLPVGGGTPHFFVQLSRLDELGEVDFASFTTSSVVHGADDDEVMLGLTSLPAMVATWRARHPSRRSPLPLAIGPSAIAARASPLGRQPPSDGTRRLALAAADPRSRAQFGAAWALGHLAALSCPGVESISVASLCGPSGLVALDGDGGVTRHPAFHVLAALCGPAGRLAVDVSDPRRIAALAGRRSERTVALVGNLSADVVEVVLAGLPADSLLWQLDATEDAPPGWRAAGIAGPTLRLAPYGVARVESGGA